MLDLTARTCITVQQIEELQGYFRSGKIFVRLEILEKLWFDHS